MNWESFKSKIPVYSESEVHPHINKEKSDLFTSTALESTEIEYLDLLYGLVRSLKPGMVLETGTFHGISTTAIAYALKENLRTGQKARFFTIEKDMQNYSKALQLFKEESLSELITPINDNTINFVSQIDATIPFDFIFFDSSRHVRIEEFFTLLKRSLIKRGTMFAFHDTSKFRTMSKSEDKKIQSEFLEGLQEIEKICTARIDFTLSRGLTLFKY